MIGFLPNCMKHSKFNTINAQDQWWDSLFIGDWIQGNNVHLTFHQSTMCTMSWSVLNMNGSGVPWSPHWVPLLEGSTPQPRSREEAFCWDFGIQGPPLRNLKEVYANGQAGVNWDLFGEHPHPRPERLQVLTLSHWTNSIGVKTTFYLIQILLGVKCAWFLLQLLFCQLQVYFSWSQCSPLMALDSI